MSNRASSTPATRAESAAGTAGTGSAAPTSASTTPTDIPHILPVLGAPLLVSPRQKGNPLLQQIKAVRWVYSSMQGPDYIMSPNTAALYLSIRYHMLQPRYLLTRLRQWGGSFEVRVVLVQVDQDDVSQALSEINRLALLHDFTVVLAWSIQEAARYLETFKLYERKGSKEIQPKSLEPGLMPGVAGVLSVIRGINKRDVTTLMTNYRSLAGLANANKEQLRHLEGFADVKASRLIETLTAPFTANGPLSSSRQRVGLAPVSEARAARASRWNLSPQQQKLLALMQGSQASGAALSAPEPVLHSDDSSGVDSGASETSADGLG